MGEVVTLIVDSYHSPLHKRKFGERAVMIEGCSNTHVLEGALMPSYGKVVLFMVIGGGDRALPSCASSLDQIFFYKFSRVAVPESPPSFHIGMVQNVFGCHPNWIYLQL